MLENLDGTSADELQSILRNLNSNAEAEEEQFISQLLIMQQRLAQTTDGRRVASPLRGLVSEARKQGLTTEALAEITHLSVPLVMKLDLRQIDYVSIPRQIVEDIAGALKRRVEQVALYLQGDPIRTAVFQSHSWESEETNQKEEFTEAVQRDSSLTASAMDRLLKMK